jgi:aspartate dehydrogenase
LKIGIVGCGTIGAEVALAVFRGSLPHYELCGLYDLNEQQAALLSNRLDGQVPVLALDRLIELSDLVFEATSKEAMSGVVDQIIQQGKSVVAMSVGGLADRPDLLEKVEAKGVKMYLPSGAIGGIDALLAAKEAGLDKVELTTTKHPRSLHGAPYFIKKSVTLEGINKPTVIFEGCAREAIQGFPANANVAITLSIAGIGVDRTKVKIIADPGSKKTKHEIFAEGPFGSIHTITEGIAAPANPRTGYLAILSAIAVLRRVVSSTRVGT